MCVCRGVFSSFALIVLLDSFYTSFFFFGLHIFVVLLIGFSFVMQHLNQFRTRIRIRIGVVFVVGFCALIQLHNLKAVRYIEIPYI